MRFYKQQHQFYCGVDLHAKTMHVCVVNQAGEVLVHRNLPTRHDQFLNAITPRCGDRLTGRSSGFTPDSSIPRRCSICSRSWIINVILQARHRNPGSSSQRVRFGVRTEPGC
jgi:hypothetical protein